MKRITIIPEEYYHVYNRGVDKRSIFQDKQDLALFLSQIKKFNTGKSYGGIKELNRIQSSSRGPTSADDEKLVEIVAFCLNPNHFHFIIKPLVFGGLERFMQRVCTGYAMYFNEKNNRSGALFQGRYKIKHINTNEYLLYLGSYVNLNYLVHGLDPQKDLTISSWGEFVSHETSNSIVNPHIILGQYQNKEDYRKSSLSLVSEIAQRRKEDVLLESMLLED